MSKVLLSSSGVSRTYLHDEQDGRRVIQTVADVSAVLDRAKDRHNAGFKRTGMGDSHTASIPITVLDAWAKQRGKTFEDVMNNPDLMDRFLLDRDNNGFIIDPSSLPRYK